MGKDPIDRATDACNGLLEVVGPERTIEILQRYERLDPGHTDGLDRAAVFFDLQTRLLGDRDALARFLDDLPAILREHDVFADYPELAQALTEPP